MKFSPPDCEHCKARKDNLFHFCHLDELDNLDSRKSCMKYKRGQIIFQEESNPIGLYCINQGKIKLYKYASDGKEQIIRIVKPGEFLGYSSLLANTVYPTSAAALEECVVCMIPKDYIQQLFRTNERFSESLINLLSSSLDDSYRKIADMAYKPVRGRLAEALLLLQTTFRDETNPDGIISVTREDLASLIGTVKETAIRILKEFKDSNIIETDKTKIIIKRPESLVQICALYD